MAGGRIMESELPFTIAAVPEDEEERLDELYKYDILDSLPEQEFDDLVALASHICGTPIAHIAFIDDSRQWFKAAKGIDDASTSREVSFCSHTIAQEEPLIISNALDDPRFRHNPLVKAGLNIRFYAGFQLYGERGHALGTLCAIDSKPHRLTEMQYKAMQALARQASALLDLRLQRKMVLQRNEELAAALEAEHRANRAREIFTYALSHELRTPLNAILGYAELIDEEGELDPDGYAQADLGSLQIAANHLHELLKDILMLGDIERSEFDIDVAEHELRTIIEKLEATLLPSLEERQHSLHIEIDPALPPTLTLDESKVRHVLATLLSQAGLRCQGGDMTLSVSRGDGGAVVFEITDNGPVLSKEQLDVIFKPFKSEKSTSTTGLALVIAKRLTQAMHGELEVASSKDETTFTLTLPKGYER